MEQHAHLVLDTAWDLGIRYFDAAVLTAGQRLFSELAG